MQTDFRFEHTRPGITRKFTCGLDVYLTVNPLPNGEPGEIFLKLGKQGSTVSGLMQAWAVTVSAALQRGVPWSELRDKYLGMMFQPTTLEYTSLIDAIAQNVDDMRSELRELAHRQNGQLVLPFQQPAPSAATTQLA